MSENANTAVAQAEGAPAQKKAIKLPFLKKASLTQRKARAGWLFVMPFVLGMLLIYMPVLIDSFAFSFSRIAEKTEVINGAEVISKQVIYEGLKHYKTAVGDSTFIQVLLSSFQQLILNVPAILIFSLFIAVILNQKMIGRAAFRAIFFIPVILATGLMETINAQDILSSSIGVDDGSGANAGDQILSMMDVEKLFSNMAVGTELVQYVVDLVNRIYSIINFSGVQMLIFLAGLQSISPSIYEASQIEGATSWETFWKITFPMISPMILVNGIYTIIDSFTKSNNIAMGYINSIQDGSLASAQSWLYFGMVLLVIAAFAGLGSLFVFYQKRD